MTRDISINLPNNIVYVTGKVNGEDKIFTLADGTWNTEAERSENDIYSLYIEAYDVLGRAQVLSTTIYYGRQLITDRTLEDIKNGNEKGYYNYYDLNRVEAATKDIAELLTANGYIVTIDTKTLWTAADFPTQSEMARYLGNVRKCVTQFCNMPGASIPASMDNLDYTGANNIEKALVNAEILVGYMRSVLRVSGTFCCGNILGLRGYAL